MPSAISVAEGIFKILIKNEKIEKIILTNGNIFAILLESQVRVQFIGRTPAFQAGQVGSIPITRSTFLPQNKCACSSVGQSNCLLSSRSWVRIPAGTPTYGGYSSVGQSARLWLQRPRVRVPLSTPLIHLSCTQHAYVGLQPSRLRHQTLTLASAGSSPASPAKYGPLAQSAEHLTFNQVVRGSNLRWLTKNRKDIRKGILSILLAEQRRFEP